MARLTTKQRAALPDKDFAGPGRSYPVEDRAHAAAAKSRAAEFASPALKAKVDAKADRKLGQKPDRNADRAADRTVARMSKPKPVR
jgi:hypothetical protein